MEEPTLPIPRQALAELLRASGSSLTPEAWLQSLAGRSRFQKYPSRARVSWWSKYILLAAAILSGLLLPFDFDFEGVLIVVLIVGFTVVEFRVNQLFRDMNPGAPGLGFRNQSGIAAVILVYCLYHGISPKIPPSLQELIDPSQMTLMVSALRGSFLTAGFIGGGAQLGLAWYYRLAQVRT